MAESSHKRHTLPLTVPVIIDAPLQMRGAVRDVLAGEYECGFHGEDLTVLDIGANVGSFTLWAHHRWPRSRIVAYEPHPQTFAMLTNNVRALDAVECVNAAVYPVDRSTIEFFSRYAGDGEAGVAECMRATFAPTEQGDIVEVPVVHPKDLRASDIVKLDVEGAEADILKHMDLSQASLVLLEYQNDANRAAIKALLDDSFELVSEDEFAWSDLLPGSGYRPSLKGDKFGHMFFCSRGTTKLTFRPRQRDPASTFADRLRRRLRALLPI